MSAKLTRLLVEGRNFEAWFLASLEVSRNVESDREQFRKANLNPLQPRDERGWWTRDGFGSSIKPLTAGAPFPPFDVLLVMTSGPGQPILMYDYCRHRIVR